MKTELSYADQMETLPKELKLSEFRKSNGDCGAMKNYPTEAGDASVIFACGNHQLLKRMLHTPYGVIDTLADAKSDIVFELQTRVRVDGSKTWNFVKELFSIGILGIIPSWGKGEVETELKFYKQASAGPLKPYLVTDSFGWARQIVLLLARPFTKSRDQATGEAIITQTLKVLVLAAKGGYL